MKKLSKLKLTELNKGEMSKQEMSVLIGGTVYCGCGCNGSSSTMDNGNANSSAGYKYSDGGNKYCTTFELGSDGKYHQDTQKSTW